MAVMVAGRDGKGRDGTGREVDWDGDRTEDRTRREQDEQNTTGEKGAGRWFVVRGRGGTDVWRNTSGWAR